MTVIFNWFLWSRILMISNVWKISWTLLLHWWKSVCRLFKDGSNDLERMQLAWPSPFVITKRFRCNFFDCSWKWKIGGFNTLGWMVKWKFWEPKFLVLRKKSNFSSKNSDEYKFQSTEFFIIEFCFTKCSKITYHVYRNFPTK